MDKPIKNTNVNIDGMIEACEEYIEFVGSDKFHSDKLGNYENSIFERALEGVYGPDVFNFINSKL